jgi:hypothetical protein
MLPNMTSAVIHVSEIGTAKAVESSAVQEEPEEEETSEDSDE